MRIGYARVTTDDQTLNLQRDALRKARCRQIYEEHASGKHTARPELEACFKSLRQGDTLIVWRLDRLGRSLADLIRLTQELQGRGVGFASLTEHIDTRSPTGKLVFHMFGALAEFERNLIREVQQHLATLEDLRWNETRPHVSQGQIGEIARGPGKGRPQHWRQGDARDRTFLDGGQR